MVVQADLDGSGLDHYRMQLVLAGGTDADPSIIAALPDGCFGNGSGIAVDNREPMSGRFSGRWPGPYKTRSPRSSV